MADENEKPQAQEIDLSDLSLQGEDIEVNPDADAFSAPPPPPELDENGKKIRYRVKLAFADGKFLSRETKNGKKYIQAPGIEATIMDEGGKFDGSKLGDRFISTLVMERTGSNRMAGILRELGVAVPARWTSVELARKFKEVIDGNPECFVEIEWSAYSEEEGKDVLRGQRRWGKKADGSPNNVATYAKTGEELTARTAISRYIRIAG